MSRCISSLGEYGSHELADSRCERCRVWECPKCGGDEPYPLDGDDHDCRSPHSAGSETFADRLARQSDDAIEDESGKRPNGTIRRSDGSGS